MKNKLKLLYIFIIGLLISVPIHIKAASCSIKVSGGSQAVVGNTITVNVTLNSASPMGSWEYLLNYNSSYLKLISGSTNVADYAANSSTKSKTYTLKFQALKSGTTSINIGSYLVYAFDETQMSVNVSNQTVKIITQAELEASYSKDNNLKALEVEGYSLNPEFNKDTTEYSVSVPSTVDKINIIATKSDSNATIEGDGEKDVVEGSNTFDIVVKAQNGAEKTYKLNVEVEDLNPIEIKIGDKKYTVVKRADILPKPTAYEETTIMINDIEVPAFKSEATGFTLVGVKDEEGNISLAIYDEKRNEYTIYNEFTSNNLILYLTNFPEPIEDYIKDTIKINDIDVEIYRYKENSRFVIAYGMNIENGKYDYYSYDTKEKTFQILDREEVSDLKNELKKYKNICIVFAGVFLFIFLLTICILMNKRKKRKKLKKKKDTLNNKMEM